MRRRILVFSVIVVPILVACGGYCGLGWWRLPQATIRETRTGYDEVSESTTMPDDRRGLPACPNPRCDVVGESSTLQDAMASAREALDEMEHNVRDYSAVIVKKERIGNSLIETVMFAKIREKPFSVYLRFMDRSDKKTVKGREVIYVQGRNDNKLVVHTPGVQDATVGKLTLDPKSWLVMQNEHHPILDIGLANLCRQLIQRGESVGDSSRGQVKRYPGVRIGERTCCMTEITYPVQEPKIRGYVARVFMDNQLRVPIRVEVHEIPLERNQEPQLVEEYTYRDLKLNNGYTDIDFDPQNPQYKFPQNKVLGLRSKN